MSALFYKLAYPCDRIRDFAYDYLEGKLPALVSLRFHYHLRGCPECRDYVDLYRVAADAEAFRRERPLPTELLDHTLAFLRREGIAGDPEAGEKPEAR